MGSPHRRGSGLGRSAGAERGQAAEGAAEPRRAVSAAEDRGGRQRRPASGRSAGRRARPASVRLALGAKSTARMGAAETCARPRGPARPAEGRARRAPAAHRVWEGGHGPLLRLKRLLEPGRAWPLAVARSCGGDCGHRHDPGGDPTQQSGHGRRQTPTVALRGLTGRSRFHVIPCWLHRPAGAGTGTGTRVGGGSPSCRRRDVLIPSMGSRAMPSPDEEKTKLVRRLGRIRGQVEAIQRALE